MSKSPYTKLPGKGHGDFSIYTLWLGDDHLLSVAQQGATEHYKRFRFADIQAFILEPTLTWKMMLSVTSITALLSSIGFGHQFILAGDIDLVSIRGQVYGVVMVCSILILLGIAILGPTCACWIKTAVQTERLYSLSHLRPTRKAIRRIQTVIDATQGTLTSDQIAERMFTIETSEPLAAAVAAPRPAPVQYKLLTHASGTYHLALFSLLLLDFVDSCLRVIWPSFETSAAFVSVHAAATVFCAIMAIVRQSGSDLPPRIQALAWIGTVYLVVFLSAAFAIGSVIGMMDVMRGDLGESEIGAMGEFIFAAVSALIAGPTAVLGLMWTSQFRRDSVTPPPLSPS